MKIVKYIQKLNILLISILFLTGCTDKKNQVSSQNKIELKVETSNTVIHKPFKWSGTGDQICILLGYGFNEKSFYNETFANIIDEYGLFEEGGLIKPLIYPDDFKRGTSVKLSNLFTILSENNIKGVLLLGAPEDTNLSLARLQDFWNGKIPYPIFSYFPQDDILGMESTCDFVLDYARTANEDSNLEEMAQHIDKSVEHIIFNTIDYIEQLSGSLNADINLHKHVEQIVGEDKKVRRYIDNETGLQSQNHFVIEKELK